MKVDVENWVREAQRGDETAWNNLVSTFTSPLHRFIYRLGIHSVTEIEDIGQEVWLRATRAVSRFEGKAQFQTWLFAIARNCVFEHYGRHREPASISIDDDGAEEEPPRVKEVPDLSPTADVERGQLWRNLLEVAKREIRPEQWAMLNLRHLEGRSLAEIAKILNKNSEQAVSNALRRAEASIRKAVRELWSASGPKGK